MRTIRFYGVLAKKYGSEHQVNCSSLHEGISELMFKFPTLKRNIIKGGAYQFYVNHRRQKQSDLSRKLKYKETDLHLVPVVSGSDFGITALYVIVAVLVVGMAIMFSNMPSQDGTDKDPSFMFNGVNNSNEEGGAVPLIYGRARVGSTVISSGIYAETFGSWSYGGGGPSSSGGSIYQKIN